MAVLGHSRPMQPVSPAGSCPLRSESDLHPALLRMTRSASNRHHVPTTKGLRKHTSDCSRSNLPEQFGRP